MIHRNPIAILCSGQGGQHPRMFDLLAQSQEAQPVFAAAAQMLNGRDPRQLVQEANEETMHANRMGQILCCTQALTAWAVLKSHLGSRLVLAGYSIGELASWRCAGLFTEDSGLLRMAAARAETMDQASEGDSGLTAVLGLNRRALEPICEKHGVFIAIINGPDHFLIGGRRNDLKVAGAEAVHKGATRVVPLHVPVPSHTPLLAKASEAFRSQLEAIAFPASPTGGVRLITTIDAEPVFETRDAIPKIAAQISQTVDWAGTLNACRAANADMFLEFGPGRALAHMAQEAFPDLKVRSLEDFRTVEGLVT